MAHELRIAFIGNPNCGKTTLFNHYTGANLKVANWPGVTVEKKEGIYKYQGNLFKLVDLPGIYSLTSYSIEEKISREYILSNEVDVIINVVDASHLERNLYLTLQLMELEKPMIIALNMMDIVKDRGITIDIERLSKQLNIPIVPMSATKKHGLSHLIDCMTHKQSTKATTITYSPLIEDQIMHIVALLKKKYPTMHNYRFHAIKLLENDEMIHSRYPIHPIERSYEKEMIFQKYAFIEKIIREVTTHTSQKEVLTDKIDNLLTHRYLGLPIFFIIMAFVFFLTFTIGDRIKIYFDIGLNHFSKNIYALFVEWKVNEILISLIIDGIITGVGGVLSFLPNIFILFLALAFLEDSGYMARVAYVMNEIMASFGLSGKAFIPMLLGFGCSVPAIMASRNLEDPHDRLKTILITPFMSCSARLPIYVLFSNLFFKEKALIVTFSMYLLGIFVAMLCAFIIHCLEKKHKREGYSLLIELPDYKRPNIKTIFICVQEKITDYIKKAGTTIFLASIVIWFLLNFSPSGLVDDMALSFGGILGKSLVPLFEPIGLGYWQIIVALISGIVAKEVVVSSTLILFGVDSTKIGIQQMALLFESINFTFLNAYALMTFCLLYIPCIATLATIKQETHSWKWTIFFAFFQLVVAWLITFMIYQGIKLIFLR